MSLEATYIEWKSLSLLGEDGEPNPNRVCCWEARRA